MFYVLDFRSHQFRTCHTIQDVLLQIKYLLLSGVYEDEIEIVSCFHDEIRFTVDEFISDNEGGAAV